MPKPEIYLGGKEDLSRPANKVDLAEALPLTSAPMHFFLACLAWLLIAAFLGAGILVMAIKGSVVLLAISIVTMVLAVWYFGCRAH